MSLSTAPRAARLEPTWLDAEYDQRARHPEHVEIGARWQTASSLVQRIESWRRDVRYGAGDGETLDIYPTPAANAPVLVFIHGGYWRSSDKSLHAFIAPVVHGRRRAGDGAQLRAVPGGGHRAHRAADDALPRLGASPRRAVRRRSGAHRRGRATPRAATWRR